MFFVFSKARSLALVLGACLAVSSWAQSNEVRQLQEVVVTATRSEMRADEVMADVTVINHEELRRNVGRSVSEVLARMAGVQTSSNGGLGKTSSIYIRGTENRHVLLLVDGVRYGSSTSGTANFDSIPLEMIERIEVLKGPASALYGSDAVGGVVQIFTRKGREGFHPYASLTAGEWDRAEVAAGFSAGTKELRYSLGVQSQNEGGFSATNPRLGSTNTSGFNADRDGYAQNSVQTSVNWQFVEGWSLEGLVVQADGVNHYDGGRNPFDVRGESTSAIRKLGVAGQILPAWKSRLELSSSADRSTNLTSTSTSRFNTEQQQWSWQNEVATPVGQVFAGLEALRELVDGTQRYTVSDRTTSSTFLGLSGSAGAHSWQANARHDRNTQFGSASTGLVGYGYKVTPDLRVHGSYGTSFKVPSFNTLYWFDPVPTNFQGNATTQPERGENAELGASLALGDQLLTVVHYENRIQGFITKQPTVSNIPYVKLDGWTLALQGEAGAWTYRTALDFLDARNEQTGKKLVRRPDLQLSSTASYVAGNWTLGATLLSTSDTFDNATNTVSLGGYTTLDVFASRKIRKDWALEGRVINLGDKFYQTALGYNQPGRAAYVTLRYQP
ncbi:TonB-dependent receptor [Rhodoferax sp. TH121]|uniref:TonB-dependent receptor domain-containing protein n=1 Tax=Rhodoferax sp. TH121 TaxID=2022803 RepID=UPI000B96A635|nr:TonB-dependent receptor [Rhodoferax sp. TH121]OYQ40277.1 TonB-dependent receptor [Rhodoferax sp. TH121]